MLIRERGAGLGTLIVALFGLAFAPLALADDMDDVMALVAKYAETAEDLAAQSKLMRDDRVMITNIRQTDNDQNMEIQMAARKANEAASGGKTRFITTVEDPHVAVYGNVAVASFIRIFNVFPHNQPPAGGNPNWVTLVMVKEGGNWKIAHTHLSPAGGN